MPQNDKNTTLSNKSDKKRELTIPGQHYFGCNAETSLASYMIQSQLTASSNNNDENQEALMENMEQVRWVYEISRAHAYCRCLWK